MESMISNPDFNIEEEELKRTKRRKTEMRDPESDPKPKTIKWRSESEQSSLKLSTKSAAIPPPHHRQPSSLPSRSRTITFRWISTITFRSQTHTTHNPLTVSHNPTTDSTTQSSNPTTQPPNPTIQPPIHQFYNPATIVTHTSTLNTNADVHHRC